MESSKVGISVCVEKVEDKLLKVGLVIHTDNPDESFAISLSHEEAMALSKDLFINQAAKSGDLDKNLGHLN